MFSGILSIIQKFNKFLGEEIVSIFRYFIKHNTNTLYLDYASTTPISKTVREAMKPFFDEKFGNPASIHSYGLEAKNAVESSRDKIAKIIRSKPEEVIFTYGGTEANNLAITGLAKKILEKPGAELNLGDYSKNKLNIIVSKLEHVSVLEPAKELERFGVEVRYLGVDSSGLIKLEDLEKLLDTNTLLISVMLANNEIGVIQNIRDISRSINKFKERNNINKKTYPYLHTDASQAPNYLDVSIEKLGVDMMSLDGSKIYGPKGIGILFKKSYIKISPIILGGSQELGLRAGTENVANIIGFAQALEESNSFRKSESERVKKLRDYFISEVLKIDPSFSLNGDLEKRLASNVNICFPNNNSEFLVIKLDELGIACSATTACKSLTDETYSYVIAELGKPECASSSLRFTLGRDTLKKDIDTTLDALRTSLIEN